MRPSAVRLACVSHEISGRMLGDASLAQFLVLASFLFVHTRASSTVIVSENQCRIH